MELGSEYHLNPENLTLKEDSLPTLIASYNSVFMESGRGALRYCLSFLEKGLVLLPELVCESVLRCFFGYSVVFYKITNSLQIDTNDFEEKVKLMPRIVFITHYFGATQDDACLKIIKDYKLKYVFTIIEDTTHSIMSTHNKIGDYCICSIRKWLPIPNGGILYSINRIPSKKISKSTNNNKIAPMILKNLYLNGSIASKSEYRKLYEDSEYNIDMNQELHSMSDASWFIANCFSVTKIKAARVENMTFLAKELSGLGVKSIVSFKDTDTPFSYPIFIDNRDAFRSYLASNSIYCAIHWPFFGEDENNRQHAVAISKKAISLPIDQRYSIGDMKYLIGIINNYFRYNYLLK